MKQLFLTLFFVLASTLSFAELEGTIVTARPGQGIGAGIVPVGAFQIQTGYDHNSSENGGFNQTNQTFNNVLRFGLSETFEVRSVLNYSDDETDNNGLVSNRSGISGFQLGFRYNVIPHFEDSWLPMFAIQTQFRMKQVSSDYQPNEVAPNFVFVLTKNITPTWGVAVISGIDYSGANTTPQYNYVLGASKSWTETLSTVFEVYGNEVAEIKSTYYGVGAGYLLNNDFQLDGYVSTGNNRGTEELYVSVGFSWRTLLIDNLGRALN